MKQKFLGWKEKLKENMQPKTQLIWASMAKLSIITNAYNLFSYCTVFAFILYL